MLNFGALAHAYYFHYTIGPIIGSIRKFSIFNKIINHKNGGFADLQGLRHHDIMERWVGGDSQVFDSIAWHEYCICKNRAKLRLKIKHITFIIP